MDWTTSIGNLFSTQTPALPTPALVHIYLTLSWTVVLGGLAAWLAGRLHAKNAWVRLLAATVVLWCLLPGPWSPVYWLGLAFRAPSVTSVMLCAGLFWRPSRETDGLQASGKIALYGVASGIVMGWLLLFDTFAVWPVSLYALGFSPALLGVTALLACTPWLLGGQTPRAGLVWSLGALLGYVLLRLPTGNLWDALLDPGLWVAMQLYAVWHVLRYWRLKVA